ncbi:MAG TPA: hypothetical protein VG860_01955 [Terriglobia bacterium]|jgi:hypothetical protein|nr:hypothetical protein [Terriglobia bacterium]
MRRRQFLKDGLVCAGLMGVSPLAAFEQASATAGSQGQPSTASELDLSKAAVVAPRALSARERKAVQVLVEEVEKRTQFRWTVVEDLTPEQSSVVVVGSSRALRATHSELLGRLVAAGAVAMPAEGYRLRTAGPSNGSPILVEGADERGVLFGVGGLLRALQMSRGRVVLPGPLEVATAPKYRLRGHQLGYRPKTNAYDAWNVAMWDQYFRDLAVFGTNAIELIPPRSDDKPDSPLFPLPPVQMMIEMSRLADEYGLDVWIWYPAMDGSYADPMTVEHALREWAEVFAALPRIDAVFVPGGDPGHTEPKYLMALLEKQAANLQRHHPQAQMWMSPQSFDEAWMNEFFEIMTHEPSWLSGIVYGPQTRIGVSELRDKLPSRYPIRLYPDITHSVECQFPVPDWDVAYALTEGREVINPRPLDYANIFHLQAPHSIGFLTYSEGCNDDVNKFIWSSLGWSPEKPVIEILREYSGYFVSDRLRDDFAHGILSLEENWKGPLIANESVTTALEQFRSMENSAPPEELLNWRFQMGLYRAYYDAYIQARLIHEVGAQGRAFQRLDKIHNFGAALNPLDIGEPPSGPIGNVESLELLNEAEAILNEPLTDPAAPGWRARVLELGEALFQSIRMQLAVERYQAEAVSRAANLDTLDAPLNDASWLKEQFENVRALTSYAERRRAIEEIIERTNPGPGGFYDSLGNLSRRRHLVPGVGPLRDPEFRASALVGHGYPEWSGAAVPLAWKCWAESLYDAPLEVHYSDLDARAQYKIRVVYSGDGPHIKIRLDCNGNQQVHPLIPRPWPPRPLEFDIPAEETRTGDLTLIWHREMGRGGNGRGCQVAEVWLTKK